MKWRVKMAKKKEELNEIEPVKVEAPKPVEKAPSGAYVPATKFK